MQNFVGLNCFKKLFAKVIVATILSSNFLYNSFALDTQTNSATTSSENITSTLGPITPLISCVSQNKDETCTAYFGYQNSSSQGIYIEAGSSGFTASQNTLFPDQSGQVQTKFFEPGDHQGVFFTDFNCSGSVSWAIKPFYTGGRTATAKLNSSKTCDSIIPKAICRDLLPGGVTKVTFGYTNPNSFPLRISLGSGNYLSEGVRNEGAPPTLFLSGTVFNAFSVQSSTASVFWNLQGIRAEANNSIPLCRENKRPICNAGAVPYRASCQGMQTTIALNSLGSQDPEGGPVVLGWSTNCRDAVLSDSSSGTPSLSLKIPADGTPVNCSVYLNVDDGVSVSSCSQEVQIPGCAKSCTGPSGEVGTIDICGVCGGDGTSCVDCLGIVHGKSVWDNCGTCGGSNTCNDCAGVANGKAKLDRCGVCNGDGKSCLDCTTSDISKLLLQMSTQVQALQSEAERTITRLVSLAPTTANQPWLREAKTDLERYSLQAVDVVNKIPKEVTSCRNRVQCKTSDRAAALQNYRNGVAGLRRIYDRTLRALKRSREVRFTKSERTQLLKTELLYASAVRNSKSVPRFSSTCE